MEERRDFYVYVYFRLDGTPCYVGKGRRNRWLDHESPNKSRTSNAHLVRIIKKSGGKLPKVKIRQKLTNEEAIKVEVALIAAIGREINGGPLVNQTDGGDGAAGCIPNDHTRKKLSYSLVGNKRGAGNKGRSGHTTPDEVRAKISVAGKGRVAPDSMRSSISAGVKRWLRALKQINPALYVNNLGTGFKGKSHTVETRAKLRDAATAAIARRNSNI